MTGVQTHMRGSKALALVLLFVASACGEEQAASSIAAPVSPLPSCEDVSTITAPADDYADSPIYVANEMPIEEVQAWAMSQPGFESIWIDREHHGWITVAFSEEAAARRVEVRDQFPGVGVVVVEVPWKLRDLQMLQARVHEELGDLTGQISSGIVDNRGVVEVNVAVLTDEIRERITLSYAGQPVCLEGGDPSDFPEPGPQPQAGDGWRLLADEAGVGFPYRTGIATDPESLRALWATIGLDNPPSDVDFETDVVIWFGAVYSSSCPDIRLDAVVVEGSLVHAEIVTVTPYVACNADANPRAFVVAVEREKLPVGPFAIQLGADDPPPGAPEERTRVDADLTVPGAVARSDQVGPDPAPSEPWAVEWGDFLEPGFEIGPYALYAHCGVEWLGEFNGYMWYADEDLSDEWLALMTPEQNVAVTLLLTTEPAPSIAATAGGVTVTYHPTDRVHPGCD